MKREVEEMITDLWKKTNYVQNQGLLSVTLVNDTLKAQDVTVPAGEQWEIYRGRIHNADNVSRDCSVIAYDAAGNVIVTLDTEAALAASVVRSFPRNNQAGAEDPLNKPLILNATDYVRFNFKAGGASAGGASKIMLQRREFKV